jgi:hypothetical protein
MDAVTFGGVRAPTSTAVEIYLAENEDLVFEHARLGGFPVTKLMEIPTVISPMTAYSD